MIVRGMFATLLVALLSSLSLADELEGVKCIMNPKADAKKDASVKYMGGEVYFCCGNCAAKFSKDTDKFAVAANRQLVSTGQYTQKACPFSGGPLKDGVTVKIGEMEVGFCCNSCQGKVAGAKDDEAKSSLVFTAAAFKKGFVSAKKDDDDDGEEEVAKCCVGGGQVSDEHFVEFNGGKVHFCCEKCVATFQDNKEKYAAKANMYLVSSKQFEQVGCPMSGGKIADGTQVKVGNLEVGFCCENCQGKVASASDEEKVNLVFADKAFKKAFKQPKDKD